MSFDVIQKGDWISFYCDRLKAVRTRTVIAVYTFGTVAPPFVVVRHNQSNRAIYFTEIKSLVPKGKAR